MGKPSAENRVLIMDDDAAMRRMMRRMVEQSGFAARTTEDPAAFK